MGPADAHFQVLKDASKFAWAGKQLIMRGVLDSLRHQQRGTLPQLEDNDNTPDPCTDSKRLLDDSTGSSQHASADSVTSSSTNSSRPNCVSDDEASNLSHAAADHPPTGAGADARATEGAVARVEAGCRSRRRSAEQVCEDAEHEVERLQGLLRNLATMPSLHAAPSLTRRAPAAPSTMRTSSALARCGTVIMDGRDAAADDDASGKVVPLADLAISVTYASPSDGNSPTDDHAPEVRRRQSCSQLAGHTRPTAARRRSWCPANSQEAAAAAAAQPSPDAGAGARGLTRLMSRHLQRRGSCHGYSTSPEPWAPAGRDGRSPDPRCHNDNGARVEVSSFVLWGDAQERAGEEDEGEEEEEEEGSERCLTRDDRAVARAARRVEPRRSSLDLQPKPRHVAATAAMGRGQVLPDTKVLDLLPMLHRTTVPPEASSTTKEVRGVAGGGGGSGSVGAAGRPAYVADMQLVRGPRTASSHSVECMAFVEAATQPPYVVTPLVSARSPTLCSSASKRRSSSQALAEIEHLEAHYLPSGEDGQPRALWSVNRFNQHVLAQASYSRCSSPIATEDSGLRGGLANGGSSANLGGGSGPSLLPRPSSRQASRQVSRQATRQASSRRRSDTQAHDLQVNQGRAVSFTTGARPYGRPTRLSLDAPAAACSTVEWDDVECLIPDPTATNPVGSAGMPARHLASFFRAGTPEASSTLASLVHYAPISRVGSLRCDPPQQHHLLAPAGAAARSLTPDPPARSVWPLGSAAVAAAAAAAAGAAVGREASPLVAHPPPAPLTTTLQRARSAQPQEPPASALEVSYSVIVAGNKSVGFDTPPVSSFRGARAVSLDPPVPAVASDAVVTAAAHGGLLGIGSRSISVDAPSPRRTNALEAALLLAVGGRRAISPEPPAVHGAATPTTHTSGRSGGGSGGGSSGGFKTPPSSPTPPSRPLSSIRSISGERGGASAAPRSAAAVPARFASESRLTGRPDGDDNPRAGKGRGSAAVPPRSSAVPARFSSESRLSLTRRPAGQEDPAAVKQGMMKVMDKLTKKIKSMKLFSSRL